MSWEDRVKEAAYISPSGVRLTFDFEDVKKSIAKKTTAFNFPDADGTLVQDLGSTGRKFPVRAFFWGADTDLEAQEFENALLERGRGRLEHPLYGTFDVVPFGDIKQRDDLKTAANQTIIEVTFWEDIGVTYPANQNDPASEVISAISEYNTAAAEEFEEVISLDSAVEKATFENEFITLLNSVSAGLQPIADTQADVKKQFDAIVDSIGQSVDVLIDEPTTLAFQTALAIQSPSRALTSITDRLKAYSDLAQSIITGEGAVISKSIDTSANNEFRTKDMYAMTYISGSISSVVNSEFLTKPQALAAADELLTQFNEVAVWRDDNLQSLEEVDTGGAYQQLQEAVSLAAGFLVEISFSLKQERKIVLDRDRALVELVAELYGSIDDQIDFFMNSNSLTGSEILEIPRGREIVYYI